MLDWIAKREARAAQRARRPPKPKTAEQKEERARRQRRLAATQKQLEQIVHGLLVDHLDTRGLRYFDPLPLIPDHLWHGTEQRPGIALRMQQVRKDAAEGCELSVRFLETWVEAFEVCDAMRHLRPPPGPSARAYYVQGRSVESSLGAQEVPSAATPGLPDLDDVAADFLNEELLRGGRGRIPW